MVVSWSRLQWRAGRACLWALAAGGMIAAPSALAQTRPTAADSGQAYVAGRVLVRYRGQPGQRKLKVPSGTSVPDAVERLRHDPRVSYANPDYLVKAAATCGWPNDPGDGGSDCWRDDAWDFLAPGSANPGGVDAEGAWQDLIDAGAPGGCGITVAG